VGLFVDIPKPKAWPPPKDPEGIQKLLSYGFRRDPVGDKVHTIFACLFMFCLPVATAPASISMAVLSVYSLMRLPSTWRGLTLIGNSKAFWAMLAWASWTVLSITWSSDPEQGLDHVKAMWALGLFFVLPPVLHNWRFLLGAFLLGVAVQNAAQIVQIVQAWQGGVTPIRPSGFNGHPGNSSLFMAAATIIWLSLLMFGRRKRWFMFAGLALSLFGVVVAQARGVWLGLFVGGFLLTVFKLYTDRISFKQTLFYFVAVIGIIFTTFVFVTPSAIGRAKDVVYSVQRLARGEIVYGSDFRLFWWRTELEESVSTPTAFLFGHGLGSTSTIQFTSGQTNKNLMTAHPHNAFIQNLYEGGVVGIGLFVFMLFQIPFSLRAEFKQRTVTVTSIVLLWGLSGMFDGVQNSGPPLSLLMAVVVFALITAYYPIKEILNKGNSCVMGRS